ncbi:MAG: helix-turn-helix domain-containing protein [Phycisphaerales bacterium JB040]
MPVAQIPFEEARGAEQAAAAAAASQLAALARSSQPAFIRLCEAAGQEAVEIPAPAVRLLAQCLADLGQSKAVGVVSLGSELSTQQVADLLGVSRPFVVKAIEEGRLPAKRVGARRRIAVEELVAFRARLEDTAQDALGQLSDLDERLGLVAAPEGVRDTISTTEDQKSPDA